MTQTYGEYGQHGNQQAPLAEPERQPTAPDREYRQDYGGEERESTVTGMSQLDDMLEDIRKNQVPVTAVWPHPTLDAWKLRFSTEITADEFKSIQKRAAGQQNRKARRSKDNEGADMFAFSRIIIQEQTRGILYKGQLWVDRDEDPITMRSDEFIELVKKLKNRDDIYTYAQAIESFLGAGNMVALGESIAIESGFGAEMTPEHP